eukprot:14636727-Ditylum_brightwellii.AAC.1
MKQAFQQMKQITKGMTGSVVSELKVLNPEALTSPSMYYERAQPFKVLDHQDEGMSVLVQQNKLHLHQEFDTPFTKKELKDYIGEFVTSCGAQEILDGQ